MKGLFEVSESFIILFWNPLSMSKGLSKSRTIMTFALALEVNIGIESSFEPKIPSEAGTDVLKNNQNL